MTISVIVSTHNRPDLLKLSIESLLNQTIDHSQYEIIVGDSYSDNNGKENKKVIDNLILKYSNHNLSYFYESRKGGYSLTRNNAALKAKSNLIVFADDDFIASSTYVESCAKSFNADENIGLVTGSLIPKFEVPPSREIKNQLQQNQYGKYYVDFTCMEFNSCVNEIPYNFVWASSFGCKKNTFIECGGFPPDGFSGELLLYTTRGESKLAEKIFNKGLSIRYISGMDAEHHVGKYRFSKKYFYNRGYIYGINSSVKVIADNNFNTISNYIFMSYISKLFFSNMILIFKRDSIEGFRNKGFLDGFIDHQIYVKNSKFMHLYLEKEIWFDFDFNELKPIQSTPKNILHKLLAYIFGKAK